MNTVLAKGFYELSENKYNFINKSEKKRKKSCLKNKTLYIFDGNNFSKIY